MTGRHSLAGSHIGVGIAAFGVASIMGVLQGLSIADINFPLRSESLYYLAVTAHGVLMALVFPIFFIMGLGYVFAQESLGRVTGRRIAWAGFWVAAVGSVMAAITILRGQSTVLYTFYPPMQAHPLFYIGATLLVVGSWMWGGVMIASYRSWQREHPGVPVSLSMHGMLATVIASLEVAGRMKGARGLFNWIGRLPWSDPFFSSVALSMIAFVFGGFGGVINAAYAMNAMVHNTAWIQGHFHVTLGTTVALSFMGATYWLLPRLTGRALRFPWLARIQPYLWFGAMVFFSTSYHIAGLRHASPRL